MTSLRPFGSSFRGVLSLIIVVGLFLPAITLSQQVTYPSTRTVNVVDYYHGQKVFDPYRWLEDSSSPETKAWVEAQTELTRGYLDSIPFRAAVKERLTELSQVENSHRPFRRGERFFFYRRAIGENQYVLYMRLGFYGDPVVVLDPNPLSPDGTVAITAQAINSDGTKLAYALSSGGSDWQEIRFRDIDPGENFPEVLNWCKFVNLFWAPDNSGIYYDRWPEPGTVSERDQYHFRKLYYHKLGTPQASDSLVYENSKDKSADFSHLVTFDGKYQVLNVWTNEASKQDIYYRELDTNGGFQVLKKNCESYYRYIDNIGTTFYFHTGLKAPGGKVISVDLSDPGKKKWRDIVPATDHVISKALMVDSCLVITYTEDAYDRLIILDLDGIVIREIELPTIGSIDDVYGRKEDFLMFIEFESFICLPTIYTYDFNSGELKLFRTAEVEFDLSKYVTRQVVYKSFGGITVPMFLTYRKDLQIDGNNPTILYGYGGFGVSIMPKFSPPVLIWLENGGIYAVANIRGGGEYGQNWHRGGMRQLKQVCFDDFANAAYWLIDSKITSPARLAIWGGSNGGLLVAASMEQHPDLFGAVICQVPVTDMIRYPKFTVGDKWISEYGRPEENEAIFSYLRKYSPYHNISLFAKYPSMLVTTGENDDRVPPLHSYKFVAALQARDDGNNPKLLRVEAEGGHGLGKPFSKAIDEQTDILAFLFHAFGITPHIAGRAVESRSKAPVDSIDTFK